VSDEKFFRYNESKGIPTLDPAHARNQTIIWPASNIFNGLVQLDSSLNVKPSIAQRWDWQPDSLLYTFYLRSDVFFHEHQIFGEAKTRKVTAHDFVYSFKRILDPTTGSSGAWIFRYVDPNFGDHGFKVLNDTVLIIRLKQPFEPFLSLLSMVYCSVVPHEVVDSEGVRFGFKPIGTGPFVLARWETNNCLILKKNQRYFECDGHGNRFPYLDGVIISFIADKQSEFMEFLLGNLDFLSGVHAAYKDELLTNDGKLRTKYQQKIFMQTTPYLNTEYLGFIMDSTHSDYVPLNIRKALNYCFDRQKMIAFLKNNLAVPAYRSIIPPSLFHFDSTELPCYSYDRTMVSNWLKDDRNPANRYRVTLLTTPDYLDIAEFLQHEARNVGIDLQIETATGAAFRQKVAAGEPSFFRASWIADYPHPENFLLLFASNNKSPAGPNYTHFSNQSFDSVYNLIATGVADRNSIIEAEKIVFDQAPIIPLYYDMVVRFVNNKIRNLPLNAMNNLELKYVQKE